jgi:hypothetical protein
MADCKPITPLATFSVFSSGFGWGITFIAFVYCKYVVGSTEGFGAALFAVDMALIAITFWLAGIGSGVLALRRIRWGQCGGRGRARTGISLGILPFLLALAYFIPIIWDELSIRIWGLPGKE